MKYAVTLILSVEVDDEVSQEDIKKDIAMAEEQIGWNYLFSIQDINVDVN